MKSIATTVLFLSLFCSLNAQSSTDEAAIKKLFSDVTSAFNEGDYKKGFTYYTNNAFEIGPDGSLISGKKALTDSWSEFMKMSDTKPVFTYSNPSLQWVTADVAVLSFDSEADIKIQGQQVGGKTKGIAVCHKVNGKWLIEADAVVPITTPPSPEATAQNNVEKIIEDVYHQAMKAIDTRNARAITDLFTEKGVMIDPLGSIHNGKDAIYKNYVALFQMLSKMPPPSSFNRTFQDRTHVFLAPTKILLRYSEVETRQYGDKKSVDEMAYSVILSQENGKWLIENLTLTPKTEMPTVAAKN
ncbi:MAG: SgcJ/EcaC family oxidoreductase [Saprospiraceae bacterium]|nr:SgcJ/EcaC family oxidoreductase [Saprospiraceae bacterium]